MQTDKTENMTDETTNPDSPEMLRREFMKKFGVYAAGSAIGLYVLLSPTTSKKAMCASDGAPG